MQIAFIAFLAAFLAVFGMGCGKDAASDAANADAQELLQPVAESLDSIIRRGAAGVAQKDAAAAAAAAAAAVETDPDSAEAHLLAGQAAYLGKDYDRAYAEFGSVAKEKSLPKELRSKGYAGMGLVDFVRNRVESARILFLQAQLLDHRNESAWYHLGLIYRDTYQFLEAALDQFQVFTRLSRPDDPHVVKVGRTLIPEIRKAIQRHAAERPGAGSREPGRAAKLLEEAQALEAKGRLKLAKGKYADALAKDPLSYPAALGYAHLLKRTGKTAEDVDKALVAYRAAIDQRPAVQKNYLDAARLAYANRRWATAVQIMDRAIAHDSKNADSLDMLIGALIRAGNGKLAKTWSAYRAELGK